MGKSILALLCKERYRYWPEIYFAQKWTNLIYPNIDNGGFYENNKKSEYYENMHSSGDVFDV
jgi:hypothetical protein